MSPESVLEDGSITDAEKKYMNEIGKYRLLLRAEGID